MHKTKDISPKDLRNFGCIVGAAFLVIAGYFAWRGKAGSGLSLGIGLLLIFFGVFLSAALKPIYRAWMALGTVLGFIMTNAILIIFFYLIVTPIGFFLRMFSQRFFDKRFKTGVASYWNRRGAQEIVPERLTQQF